VAPRLWDTGPMSLPEYVIIFLVTSAVLAAPIWMLVRLGLSIRDHLRRRGGTSLVTKDL